MNNDKYYRCIVVCAQNGRDPNASCRRFASVRPRKVPDDMGGG